MRFVVPMLWVVLSAAICSPPVAARDRMVDQAFAAAAATYETALQNEGVVGGAIVLMNRDGVLSARPFGLADKATGRAVDADTLFHWASVTKVFTSIAAMQLVETGQLSLDDPVVRYIPEFRQVHSVDNAVERVTIRHLLSHSAGLRGASWPWNPDGASDRTDWQPLEPREWSQIAAMLPYTALADPPGTKAAYSNLGLLLLGEIVGRIVGEPIEVRIDKAILKPLGMTHSYFDRTPRPWRIARTHDYTVSASGIVDHGAELDSGITSANGGLNGTIGDMAKFVGFLLGDPRAAPIVSRATVDAMITPQLGFQTDTRRSISVGLGFFVTQERDMTGATHQFFGHSGFQRGHRSALYLSADGCCAMIFAANTVRQGKGNPSASALRVDLVDTVFPLMRQKQK